MSLLAPIIKKSEKNCNIFLKKYLTSAKICLIICSSSANNCPATTQGWWKNKKVKAIRYLHSFDQIYYIRLHIINRVCITKFPFGFCAFLARTWYCISTKMFLRRSYGERRSVNDERWRINAFYGRLSYCLFGKEPKLNLRYSTAGIS